MIRVTTCLLLVVPTAALAQGLPALYDVVGVSENDTLNVRVGPSTQFDIVSKLPPDAEGLEVVDLDKTGEWGLINIEEMSGWVSLTFMKRQAGQVEDGLPRAFACYGTEPSWSFDVAPDLSASFKEPSADGTRQTQIGSLVVVPSANRTDRHALFGGWRGTDLYHNGRP
ncbi:MAG: SH3 domain-containing protein [Pseudomonadota bacterium]